MYKQPKEVLSNPTPLSESQENYYPKMHKRQMEWVKKQKKQKFK